MYDTQKNAGLSRLADVSNEQNGVFSYPVKKKGQRRRLTPNWSGIKWLEADEAATEIEERCAVETEGLVYTFAYGRHDKIYRRPMFQLIPTETASPGRSMHGHACPCGDFSRTAYCDEHGELDFDWKRRAWIRPGTSTWYEHHPEDRPAVPELPTIYVDTGQRPPYAPPGGLYDRLLELAGHAYGSTLNLQLAVQQSEEPDHAVDPQEVRIEGLFGEGTVYFRVQPE